MRQRLSYCEVAQNDVAFEVVGPEVEFFQRRVAVVDPWTIFFFEAVLGLNVELVLFRVILKIAVFSQFIQNIVHPTHHTIVEPHGGHKIRKLGYPVIRDRDTFQISQKLQSVWQASQQIIVDPQFFQPANGKEFN